MIATFSDVTEIKATRDSANQSHQSTVEVLESISDAFFSLDKNFRVDNLNSNHERLTKKSREEQMGRSIFDLFFSEPGASETIYWKSYHRAMTERVPVYFEDYYPALDLWTAVNVYPKPNGGLAVFLRTLGKG